MKNEIEGVRSWLREYFVDVKVLRSEVGLMRVGNTSLNHSQYFACIVR